MADKVINEVLEKYKEADDYRQPKEENLKEYYQLYRSYREEREDDKSNLFIPYVFGLVETVVPRIVDTIFSKRPFLKPLPNEPSDIEASEAMEVLLDYQLQKSRFQEKTIDWVKQGCIYGKGYVKVFWDKQTEKQVKKKQRTFANAIDFIKQAQIRGTDNISSYIEVEEEITKYEGANIELCDRLDIYLDPFAEDIENARYIIQKSLKPVKHIKDMIKSGVYNEISDKKLEELEESTAGNDTEDFSVIQRQTDIDQASNPQNSVGMVEILEYWEDNRVITIANEKILLRNEPNPFHHKKKPYVALIDTKVPKESDGIGEIEPNRYLQAELNTNRNQRIENVKYSINNAMFYDAQAIEEEDIEIDKPNKKIGVRNRGQKSLRDLVYPMPKPQVPSHAYTEEDIIKQDMQETSGVTKYVRGIQPSGSATATEITSLQREANYRFKQKIRNAVIAIEKVGEFYVALNQQFLDEQQYIRISGDREKDLQFMQKQDFGDPALQGKELGYSFLNVAPSDIAGNFDIRVSSSALEPLADKQVRRQQLLEFLQISMQSGINLPSIVMAIAKTYNDPEIERAVDEYKQQMAEQQELNRLKFEAQNKGNPQTNPQAPNPQAGQQQQLQNMLSQLGGMNG